MSPNLIVQYFSQIVWELFLCCQHYYLYIYKASIHIHVALYSTKKWIYRLPCKIRFYNGRKNVLTATRWCSNSTPIHSTKLYFLLPLNKTVTPKKTWLLQCQNVQFLLWSCKQNCLHEIDYFYFMEYMYL